MSACNNYYEPFKGFHEKIKNACECIGENGHEAVATEVETIKSSISSLDVSGYWDDSVGQDFITVKESFVGSLETVLSSINGTWSTSEGLYQNLNQELQNLSDTQTAYIEFWGTKPQESEYKETIIAVDKNGSETSHTITMPEYWRKLAEWNNQNADYLIKFQGIIDRIKSLAEQLASLGNERVSVGDLGTIGGLSSIVAQFSSSFSSSAITSLVGTLANYISEHGLSYSSFSKWGEEFYTLANITGCSVQPSNLCLGYANANAKSINKRNGTDSYEGYPIMYSSKDKQEILQIAATEFLAGRAVVFEVQGTEVGKHSSFNCEAPVYENGVPTGETVHVLGSNRHYVAVYGIRKGADLSNLKESDFLYVDSAGGEVKQLNTHNGGSQQRDLQYAPAATCHASDEYYCINVFDNTNAYDDIYTNTKKLEEARVQNGASGAKVYFS